MLKPLITADNLHQILRVLYESMIDMCEPMASVASAIAGIGAMLYISYRVWQSLARAEPIDLFPLLRPFAISICIMFFPTLVLGSINGLLSPIVKATHSLMVGQTFDMQKWQKERDEKLRQSNEEMPADGFYEENAEMEQELDALGLDDQTQNTMDRMDKERSSWSFKGMLMKALGWLLELIFAAAGVILDVLRTFYLIVLSLLGPIAFAISVFDGFQNSLSQWLSKYVSVYLWLPISDLFSAIIARLQTLSLQNDAALAASGYDWYFDSNSTIYLVFILVAICGYFCIPSIASWVVQANGFGSYNRAVGVMTAFAGGLAGYAVGKTYSTGKVAGKGISRLAKSEFSNILATYKNLNK